MSTWWRLAAKKRFAKSTSVRPCKHFFHDGALTPGQVAEAFVARAGEIDRAIVAESARWGDAKREPPYLRDINWVVERDRVVNGYIPARSNVVLNQFIADGMYPTVAAPDFLVNGTAQHGGSIDENGALAIAAPAGTIYYTTDGSDPRTGPPVVVTTTLVSETAAVRALVPTSAALGTTWTQSGYSDAAWLSGASGVGYERATGFQGLLGLDLLSASVPAASRIDTNGDGTNENNSVFTRYAVEGVNCLDIRAGSQRYDRFQHDRRAQVDRDRSGRQRLVAHGPSFHEP